MRAVLQRVTGATVHVDGRLVSRIGPGIVALIGLGSDDTADEIPALTKKILGTNLWNEGQRASQIEVPPQYAPEEVNGGADTPACLTNTSKDVSRESTNLKTADTPSRSEQVWGGRPWRTNVKELEGEVLCISQFTLHARLTKGTKPDFHKSMKGPEASELYTAILQRLRDEYIGDRIKDGAFGEMMQCSLTNDGPVTILIDTAEKKTS